MKLLLNIKKENDDLGKQVNNLANILSLTTYIKHCLVALIIAFSFNAQAQDLPYSDGKKYTLGGISVSGNTTFSEATIITTSGLRKGKEITIPGEDISKAIKKLWGYKLFSDIEVYISKIEGDIAYLEIRLSDLPQLNELKINGVKKGKKEAIIKETGLNKGTKVTENLITTTKNFLTKKYKKNGFYNSKILINTIDVKDSLETARVNMVLNIDKGEKVKVKDIVFSGNNVLSDKKLRKAMKNTKKINRLRILKRSKFIDSAYQADLNHVIDKYKENGYRDARILSDSLVVNDDNKTVSLHINVNEGELYTFGDITFIGNTVYSNEQLNRYLRIKKGDTYNGVLLQERIADNSKPDAADITNLYQNSGYLFSSINPVEVNADGNVIDMEIRISEGKPAYFNKVSVVGNDKTNDHVIYRMLRTRPGQLYSKENVVRSVRELGQLGFFDAQEISPNFNNPNPNEGTIDMEYSVKETGSSQIELQGGYGGGGFIGTLGLSFNNFSIKDIFKKEAYKPIPMGDGQKLALRLQASRFYQTYSFSFSEPWLGGKKPVQFSTSLSHTKQFLYNPITRNADKSRRFNITGLSVGLAKRLTVPDDYFTLSQAVSFQHYDLQNYNTGLFTFGDGSSNNLSYTIGLSRNNTRIDPIYPTGGSNFSATAKFSVPYSLFNKVDYKALKDERDDLEIIIGDGTKTIDERTEASDRVGEIDQERYKWLEFYKINFKGDWYTEIVKDLVLKPSVEFGFLGAYNNDRGVIPFERFFVGGDGLGNYSLDGREAIALRGYPNQSLSDQDGGTIYNKFSLELRYPITLKASAKIYALGFLEGGASYNSFRDYNPFDIKRSAGLGIRIFMPAFGLLGIDFGHGFDALPGQTAKNGWETHFIIGQQF
ncbi:outer membrane protein assembly factor BamA [Jejuia spongiicola]|uniref:Outer membrane protein assembly factor BamA n=1 Tax=Jejuia spongiicola TaxID=2942207 RepID=A0ABT0QEI7_9FLAO|nr:MULTISPECIES: outer membrane protein assembly factor BamA [Flavobacteriaceae]MCL6295411.1 outer membrane protein assembly factor BamA [Jejuia spongiicola]PIA81696.1 outer membrane protein assembly factor BamA [Gaetbulibacter sp. 4G1]